MMKSKLILMLRKFKWTLPLINLVVIITTSSLQEVEVEEDTIPIQDVVVEMIEHLVNEEVILKAIMGKVISVNDQNMHIFLKIVNINGRIVF